MHFNGLPRVRIAKFDIYEDAGPHTVSSSSPIYSVAAAVVFAKQLSNENHRFSTRYRDLAQMSIRVAIIGAGHFVQDGMILSLDPNLTVPEYRLRIHIQSIFPQLASALKWS